jgi:signal transduction histidine kinase
VSYSPNSPDETARQSRLRDYRILDTLPETTYDRIARLAALALDVPMAAISLVDGARLWFKARVGLDAAAIPRLGSICTTVLTSDAPLIVPDTTAHPEFRDTPMVAGPPHIRFYVGVPLRTPDGLRVGTLCAMDSTPRPPPSAPQIAMLRELAALAMEELELRRVRDGGQEELRFGPREGTPYERTLEEEPRPADTPRGLLAAYVAKSEFLASLSHELRTPLNAISGYAGLIAGADDTPATTAEHAGEIMSATRHMLALVNDILEYSRLEAGTLPIGWQRVPLRPPVEEALRMVSVFATSRGIRLERDFSRPDAVVRGDAVRIKQVLLNLLTNAIKFTPRGGIVTVSLTQTPPTQGGDEWATITVRDTGIGIAAEDIPKTLVPFGQIMPQDGGQAEGTGLGLPIAKALVERLGGTLTLESRLGFGTTVSVHLPALVPQVPARDTARDMAAASPSKLS